MDTKIKAAGDGHPQAAQTLNLPSDFIAEAMQGQASGGRLIRELGINICEVDKLFHEIQPITRSPVALRVFCRALQKHFEKGGRL